MGLGKTVEIMGLMLMNRFQASHKRKSSELNDVVNLPDKALRLKVKCICHKNDNKKGTLISCTQCSTTQHLKCVFQRKTTQSDIQDYLCPYCWKTSEKIVEGKTTIIVTPSSITTQWRDEFQRHISDNSFKTLMYTGISDGWVSPRELTKYDAVITDFNTLSRELYFCKIEERSLRHDKKFDYPASPLTSVLWWRGMDKQIIL